MKIVHKKVGRDYFLMDTYEAGIVLTGAEVKSVRNSRLNLSNAYVRIKNGELFLINAEIPVYKYARPEQYDPTRTRKLLLTKREIIKIDTKLKSSPNLTIMPVSCYNKGVYFKCQIALAKSKRKWEKKRFDKDKRETRRIENEAKEALKRG